MAGGDDEGTTSLDVSGVVVVVVVVVDVDVDVEVGDVSPVTTELVDTCGNVGVGTVVLVDDGTALVMGVVNFVVVVGSFEVTVDWTVVDVDVLVTGDGDGDNLVVVDVSGADV